MKVLPLDQITLAPGRQRQKFDIQAHQDLVTSIRESAVGLQNPPVVRQTAEGYTLISGERRVRAMKDILNLGGQVRHGGQVLPAGCIPVTLVSELSEIDAEEAELFENIHRADLTWQERADATARLERLRTAQAVAAGKPLPTAADISQEVRGERDDWYRQTTTREMIVAKHLKDPEVASAKTLDDAFRILKRKEKDSRFEALAEEVGPTFTSSTHQVINGNCLEWLAQSPSDAFDVILTDPPYGMGADSFGDSGGVARAHFYEDTYESWKTMMSLLCPQLFRVAKPNAHLYLFCDLDRYHEQKALLESVGWRVHRTPLVWYKGPPGYGTRMPWPDKGPKRTYEIILYAMKGDRPVQKALGDVLSYPLEPNLGHSAQKPVGLFADLLSRSALPGNTVLDPFCGTGPILPAASLNLCRATAIEAAPAAYGIALNRLKDLSK